MGDYEVLHNRRPDYIVMGNDSGFVDVPYKYCLAIVGAEGEEEEK